MSLTLTLPFIISAGQTGMFQAPGKGQVSEYVVVIECYSGNWEPGRY